jgi:arylsulfatase A-like enzyme
MTGKARWGALGVLVFACLVAAGVAVAQVRTGSRGLQAAAADPTCQLTNGKIKHVIYIQFDNTHLSRDNPNVPSDLQQMPHLLNFLKDNGTVMDKHYTILISHTAGGILSSLTGLYPDRMGVTVSNSYDYYRPDLTPTFTSAFKYWTAPVAPGADNKPNMVNGDSGTPKIAPAPWVSYTRAGCDVGNVSVANTVLENNSTAPGGDIYNVYGPGSSEAAEPAALRTTDFVGIAVHCGNASDSVCTKSTHAKPDPLPDEPGGYNGFQALFGAKYVNPAISGAPAVNDINGNPITDPAGHPGFPGFDGMSAANTLGYVAQMQEAGVPVTFAYISDVHDNHAGLGAYGPGESGYVNALKSYDDAFGKFFDRLAADGINKSNTLFVVTADENDHFAGQQAQNCDGVTTPCVYNTFPGDAVGPAPQHGIFDVTNGATSGSNSSTWTGPATWPPSGVNGPLVGEVGYNLKWLFGPTSTNYDISFDSAPSFYINGQPQAVDSSGSIVVNPTLRAFEQRAANLQAFDPYIDASKLTPVARYLVDAPTLKALHMINADPQRTMSFTMFAQPDYFFETFSPCPKGQGCVNDGFAWIHGDYSNDIGQTWLGMAGPGVRNDGVDDQTWSDHADIVPTMMSLLGLSTDYAPDGRVITQALTASAAKGANGASFQQLGDIYKQLDAPYGVFDHSLIVASTNGIKASDATYLATEQQIKSLTAQRDALVQQMRDVLDGTTVGHREQLIHDGQTLLAQAAALAGS